MEAPLHRAVYFCSKGSDIQGTIRGIAEEYSFQNNPNDKNHDGDNWLAANQILYNFLSRIFYDGNEEREVESFIHNLIDYRAKMISPRYPKNNPVDNWLTAQKDFAVHIYDKMHEVH
ncbi:MAG: hypothetical protein AABW91_04190 [Nanoarchaeota archaeon]